MLVHKERPYPHQDEQRPHLFTAAPGNVPLLPTPIAGGAPIIPLKRTPASGAPVTRVARLAALVARDCLGAIVNNLDTGKVAVLPTDVAADQLQRDVTRYICLLNRYLWVICQPLQQGAVAMLPTNVAADQLQRKVTGQSRCLLRLLSQCVVSIVHHLGTG